MDKKFKLHELIEMAERDLVFEAKTKDSDWFNQTHFKYWEAWKPNFITADWTVRMKREPRAIWVNEKLDGSLEAVHNFTEDLAKLNRELRCKSIKFVEVIEDEE